LKNMTAKRRTGALASFVAAYALVLHVIISSFVLATVSPASFAAADEICFSHPETISPDGATGKVPGKSVFRCPLCVGNHAPGVPPSDVVLSLVRFAVALDLRAKLETVTGLEAPHSSHLARAPPHLS
jgi:hypothetical protein